MFECANCGEQTERPREHCRVCGAWRASIAVADGGETPARARAASRGDRGDVPVLAGELEAEGPRRVKVGRVWNALTGGGLVLPSTLLLSGEPGAGKTTRAARLASAAAKASGRASLYLSAEMPAPMVKMLAEREGEKLGDVFLWHVTELEAALRAVRELRPALAIFDSVQAFGVDGDYGSDRAVKEVVRLAKRLPCAVLLVSQVNAEGLPAGPKRALHDVDTVVSLTAAGDATTTKNRYGPVVTVSFAPSPKKTPPRGKLRAVA